MGRRKSVRPNHTLRLNFSNNSSVHIFGSFDHREPEDVDGTLQQSSQPCRMRLAATKTKAEGHGISLGKSEPDSCVDPAHGLNKSADDS